MSKRPTFEAFKKRALQDKEVKAAYDLLEPEFALLEKLIKAKKKARNYIRKNNMPKASGQEVATTINLSWLISSLSFIALARMIA